MKTICILSAAAALVAAGVWGAESATAETALWQKAIDEASARGGGRVIVPAGRHVVGMLVLKSDVELCLSAGAVLSATDDAAAFRRAGLPSAVVCASGATNVAVTGTGEIFGNAWAWPAERRAGVMGLSFRDCRNVRLEDFTLRDADSWGIHLYHDDGVVARRVKIDSQASECNDGFDIESRNVLIEDCDVDAGDDAYCLKASDPDYAVEHVRVRDCVARSHCNAFKFGTGSAGTMRDVSFEHCAARASRRMYRDVAPMPKDLLRWKPVPGAPWYHCGPGFGAINVECVDGGIVEDVLFDDISVEGFQTPIFIRGGRRRGDRNTNGNRDDNVLRRIVIRHVRGRADGTTPSTITGVDACRPEDVTLEDVDLEIPGSGKDDRPFSWPGEEMAARYPQTNMFDAYRLPAYGLFVDKASVTLANVRFTLRPGTTDGRPPVHVVKTRVFPAGVHYLTETKVFTAADSGTVWKAAPGARVVISGGRRVTGWRPAADGLWVADVPWVTGRENGFRQFTVDGALRPRAKHPNRDYFTSLDFARPKDCSWFKWEYGYDKNRFRINPGEVDPKWDLSKGEVIFYHIWVDSHCPAASLSVEGGTNWLGLASVVRRNPCNCLWRLENLREIADAPGEWALDYGERRVYYRPMPDENPAKAEIAVPFLDTLVRIDGARNVRFEGISFEDSRYELARTNRNDRQASADITAAVVLTNAADCVFERCSFTHLSGYALDFQAGTRDSKVLACRLSSLGAGGIRLNGGVPAFTNTTATAGFAAYEMPDPRDRVRGNEIADCEIGDYGRDFPSAVGVLLMNAEETKVRHNAIHDGYYTGVSVGWNWGYLPSVARDNEIEFNHIYNIGKGLISDMGGIYLLGIAPGTRVRNNLIHDVDARYYGGWGIYPDEGSSGLLIENNVVYNTKFAAFHQHFGRNNTVRNNIFAGGKVDQLARSRWEEHTSFFFYDNIVFWREGELHSGDWADEKTYRFMRIPSTFRAEDEIRLKKTTECDYNLYFNPTKKLSDVRWGTQKCSWNDWRGKYLQDRHSVWGDPLFVDEAKHDYRLRPDSPAFALGFRQIDLSTVGPR